MGVSRCFEKKQNFHCYTILKNGGKYNITTLAPFKLLNSWTLSGLRWYHQKTYTIYYFSEIPYCSVGIYAPSG